MTTLRHIFDVNAARIVPTRESRKNIRFSTLPPAERENLLSSYHPDYKAGAYREVRVGANKGGRTVSELADLLESDSPLDAGMSLVPDHTADLLVIGGGGAGCTAALIAHRLGIRAMIATKLRLGDSNTVMAEGGVQAAVAGEDSPALHFKDAVRGGHYKNDRELLRVLVEDGPEAMLWLCDQGVLFDREPDGRLRVKAGGGTSRARLLACEDYTGLDIMRALKESVVHSGIPVIEYAPAVELLSDGEGRCTGAVLQPFGAGENGQRIVVRAKTVLLAAGGIGRLHFQGFPTSNHFGATGDALVMAYRLGSDLVDIDTFQYHPTGVIYPGFLAGALVTEGMRSMGAQLLNSRGERFIDEMETRDVVSAAIIRECHHGRGISTPSGKCGVWLDTPMIDVTNGAGTLQARFPNMVRQFTRVDLDISKQAILVYPTLHYQNGGIRIDASAESAVSNLFAAGEATGGIHGRNRLMGNSLLDVVVFGRRAGEAAARRSREIEHGRLTLDHLARHRVALKEAGIAEPLTGPILVPTYARAGAGPVNR